MYEGQAIMIASKYDLPHEMIEFLSEELTVDVSHHDTVEEMERKFSNALYRRSGCGLSFGFIEPHDRELREEKQFWWVEAIKDGLTKARAAAIWKDGEPPRPLDTVPRVVRMFFSLIPYGNGKSEDPDPSNDRMNVDWKSVEKVKVGNRVPHVEHHKDRMVAKAEIEIPVIKFIPGGVKASSIVEGVDRGTGIYERIWPFTSKDFYGMIDEVGEEAKEIWNNTHGCERCAEHWDIPWRLGATMVNTDCSTCGGGGIVI